MLLAAQKGSGSGSHNPPLSPARRRAETKPPAPPSFPPVVRKSAWEREPEPEPEEQPLPPNVVPRKGGSGRRSARFPHINISATAEKLGCTKAHLAKVLSGASKPSIDFALRLADLLDKDLNYIAALYKGKATKSTSPPPKARKRK